jgi:excisionase family DNA binding protein
MPTIKLYTVKEASKIVGVSTNTLYKYLLEGQIKAARGTHKQGRFRIPVSALEEFLGTPIPSSDTVTQLHSDTTISPTTASTSHEPLTMSNPPSNRKKLIRFFLLLALIALIADTILSPTWSVTSGLLRLATFALLLTVIYKPRRTI